MRNFGKLLLLVLFTGCANHHFETSEPTTENRYIAREDFLRISEYFTGREPQTDRVFIRSVPEKRAGYYWILPVDQTIVEQQPIRIELWVQRPGSPEIIEFRLLPQRNLDRSQTLWIGLTGEDWPNEDLAPVAWKLSLLSSEGREILSRQSYLWPEESGAAAPALPDTQ